MPTVFVIARDWMLRSGVRAELRERGVEALGMESVADAERAIAGGTMPAAVVVDADDAPAAGVNALDAIARRAPMLVIASRMAAGAAPPNAADVLARPITVGEIVARVLKLLEGTPA